MTTTLYHRDLGTARRTRHTRRTHLLHRRRPFQTRLAPSSNFSGLGPGPDFDPPRPYWAYIALRPPPGPPSGPTMGPTCEASTFWLPQRLDLACLLSRPAFCFTQGTCEHTPICSTLLLVTLVHVKSNWIACALADVHVDCMHGWESSRFTRAAGLVLLNAIRRVPTAAPSQ